jgi:2-polyprenyl-3-methyl-5-hydroxy-6-metoxy-1,4-benzoquinol methylase
MTEPTAIGWYEQKQLRSRSRLISWSHTSRFDAGRRFVAPYAGGRLLDYGTGDATFLKRNRDLFPNAVGADIDEKQVRLCRELFAGVPGFEFVTNAELATRYEPGTFDVVTCMEVLEHCVDDDLDGVLAALARFARAGGRVIISVPIEIGPSLVAKQIVRRVAALRGLGDYRWMEGYTPSEMARMVLARATTSIDRPRYHTEDGGAYHGHKGFNWRALERRLRRRFRVLDRHFSPLDALAGALSSQIWFICEPLALPPEPSAGAVARAADPARVEETQPT